MRTVRWFVVVCTLVLSAPLAQAQAPPKPGPEFDALKEVEGTWDATLKGPGGELMAKATMRMDLGGLWLLGDIVGEIAGQKIQVKGMMTYDAAKKKYVSVYVDSMSTTVKLSEGTYDKDTKRLTLIGEEPGPDGKLKKVKVVMEQQDKDTFIQTMSSPDKDGKDQVLMTITYKRTS